MRIFGIKKNGRWGLSTFVEDSGESVKVSASGETLVQAAKGIESELEGRSFLSKEKVFWFWKC